MAMLATVATIAGTFVQAAGTLAAGKAQKQALDYEAAQAEREAKYRQAAAQTEAEQYKRNKELTLSSLQARSAASGFSATDPTALALADEISRYGTYQEQLAQFGGKRERSGLEAQAAGKRLSGQAALKGARYSAAGTILGGVSSVAGKYRGGSYSYG